MIDKLKIIKHKTMLLLNKALNFFKARKKISISILLVLVLLIFAIIYKSNSKEENLSGNLNNLGFSVNFGKTTYCLGYKDGIADGIYKISGKNKTKISDDYGYYLNKSGNYIYYIDAIDNNIIRMKTNGKKKDIIVENVDTEIMTVVGDYIYYFDNSYFYRIKTNGENKKRISNKSLEMYQIVGKYIYYSYMDNGSYSIAKMKTDGENNQKIASECGKAFCVDGKHIYYICENNGNSNETFYELYKMNKNGENKKQLAKIEGILDQSSINFYGNLVYYAKRDTEWKNAIYKIDLNGKNETKITDIVGYVTKINVNNNWIYYPDENNNNEVKIYRIKTNGTNKQEL